MNQIGENIRMLRKKKKMTQADLATQFGIAQNTIANYENGKRFPDQNILIQFAVFFDVSLDALTGRVPFAAQEFDKNILNNLFLVKEKYLSYILEGQEKEAIELLLQLSDSNYAIFQIFEKVLTPVLYEIGSMWHFGKINSAWEHYATAAVEKTLTILAAKILPESPKNKKAVCLSYSSDPHCIGIHMVSEFLKSKGIQTYYLGNNVPSQSLISMLEHLQPDLLAISVTLSYHLDGLKKLLALIRENKEFDSLKIILGGQAFHLNEDVKTKYGVDGHTRSLQEITNFI